jgi:dipeptidyl aminopeptidase/acylaminoacyl peptidase
MRLAVFRSHGCAKKFFMRSSWKRWFDVVTQFVIELVWRHLSVTRRKALVSPLLICIEAATICLIPSVMYGQASKKNGYSRPVTIADSITMTMLGDPLAEYVDTSPAQFSPNGKQFVVVTRKGNLALNTNEYDLLLFESAEVFDSPEPQLLLTLASSSSRAAIANVRWKDNETIIFLGEKPGQTHRIYTFNVKTKKLAVLSQHSTSIVAFDATSDLATVIFLARPKLMDFFDVEARKYGLLVSDQQLTDLMVGHGSDKESGMLYPFELFVEKKGGVHKIPLSRVRPEPVDEIFLSPDGRHAVIKVLPRDVPDSWKVYNEPIPSRIAGDELDEYLLVDTQSGFVRPLIDAPAWNWKPSIAWLSDGQSVIVAGTYLPLSTPDEREREARKSNTYVAEVNINTGKLSVIALGSFDLMYSEPSSQSVILRPRSDVASTSHSAVAYRKTGNIWREIDPALLRPAPSVQVAVEQNMNTPPRLVAEDPKGGRKTLLLELNPQFGMLNFGKVEEITWTSSDGQTAKGGLYLPPDYTPEHKYPLVIQTHGWNPAKFWIDGISTAGYAAQALAGKDIIVAQTEDNSSTDIDTVREGPQQMSVLEGLIDYLDRRGMIDRTRVGLLGWSRTGYHVRYALTFSKYHFATAVIADGLDGSYLQYMEWLNLGQGYVDTYERLNGGAPFGAALQSWFGQATGFNLDRVQTPVRLLAFRPYSLLSNWEWFAVLRHLGKPVELIWLPEAEHAPVKPSERMAAQQGDVDWFSFWMKGEEDPDPAKTEQYARWRELRKLQEQSDAKFREQPRN